ncbi:MAG: serine protease [bacterium]|nr:serine protease [bacterium]
MMPAAAWVMSILAAGASTDGAGFDRAIGAAIARTVKLYGMGAGLEPGYGSGIVVSPEGQVLTVDSILIDARRIRAVTADGRQFHASVVFRDHDRQMALLQLKAPDEDDAGPQGMPAFTEGRSDGLQPGDWVIAAGNLFNVAAGSEPVSIATGVFSGRTRLDARRRERDYPFRGEVLAIDAITSNPGAPGGPLVDLEGNWVGMIGRVVVSRTTHTQFNHAFTVEQCLEFLRDARGESSGSGDPRARRTDDDAVDPAKLVDAGIKLFEMGYRKKLVYVESVRHDSPAARAGLRSDDLIVSADGREVADVAAFRRLLSGLSPGQTLELVVLRDDKHHRVDVVLEATE